ncbi:MAG: DUF4281 domain-containing protein [Planctomycetia bacterium]|nr:DUF4281 domain-containing protein [Planctomycetia bacterium]
MSPEIQFKIVNTASLPFWALMIFAPRWWLTRRVMESYFAPGLFAAIYVAFIIPALPNVLAMLASPPNLENVVSEIAKPQAFVVAWIHYLAFDLFVGRWEYLDSRERGVSVWLVGPCLFMTLMTGPLGFLAYLAIRGTTIFNRKS